MSADALAERVTKPLKGGRYVTFHKEAKNQRQLEKASGKETWQVRRKKKVYMV